jgi:hypothetical protein
MPVCYGLDPAEAEARAHERFRWSQLGWKVMAELPNPVNFAAATTPIDPAQVGAEIPHGPDVGPYLEAVQRYADAGFTRLAFVQIGDDQDAFFDFWNTRLRDALSEVEVRAVEPVAAAQGAHSSAG